ncbi:MAG TPA: flagella basal body P-ring formation protein FlgA [Rhodospirillaceae bacterium]|nr:flagella basal body P-ring formation protein FlgA [Rhodospirillaceae bacterium]
MKLTTLLGLILSGFVFCASPSVAEETLTLRPTSQIERSTIRLSDVFDALPAGKDIDIAVAPAPGKSVTYDTRVLAQLARQHGLNWQPQSMVDKSVLTRAATALPLDRIEQAVLDKVAEKNALPSGTTEVLWDNKNLNILLPAEVAPDFSLVNFTYDQQNNRFRGELVVQMGQTGATPITKPLSGRLIVKRMVPVLAKHLTAGTVVGARDLMLVSVGQEQIGIDVLTAESAIIGQELRHDHAEGQFVRTRDVAPPRLVTRGALVTLRVETPLMQITTQGRALQDGAKGDVIRVTNTQSNRVIEGVIEADGIVRVPALQKIAAIDSQKE